MNNKLKTFLASALVVSAIGVSGIAAMAREIQDLTKFSLPAWKAIVSTSNLVKSTTNAPWVLNITSLSNATTVDTYLANSDGDRRSDYTVVGTGRHEINSNGQAGFKYHAVLMNSKSTSSTGYLTGSWSPDKK